MPAASYAQESRPEITLSDPEMESQARTLFQQLRCEVCEGQTIADSNAPLAQDMRAMVRDKLAKGESASDILAFFASRYGDAILMRPPVELRTAPLWLAPLLIFAFGLWLMLRYFSRSRSS